MTTDVSGGEITSQFANDQGVGQCPYPTQVCAITLSDSFLTRCSSLPLVIDRPFLYCS